MRIYKTTNLINGKIYIGQTKNKYKYIGSGNIIKKAIKKYGFNNFKFEIIIEGDFNKELTDHLEKHYIRLYNSTNNKIGYNISEGGYSARKHKPHKDKKPKKLSVKERKYIEFLKKRDWVESILIQKYKH